MFYMKNRIPNIILRQLRAAILSAETLDDGEDE